MNHLAHLFLSQTNTNLMVGNFIADQVKGKQIEHFTAEIQRGINMHRAIDAFTDSHPVVLQSKERLYPKYHKYAAVIIDIYYDHILAKNWNDYSPIAIERFAHAAYLMLKAKNKLLPEKSQGILKFMIEQDWLSNYASLSGIEKALQALAYRATFESKMEQATVELKNDYALYKADFNLFFPALVKHVQTWLVEPD